MLEGASRPPIPWASLGAAALGIASVAWVPLSLWPDVPVPAWPAASGGLAALALALGPGRIGPRALGTLAGALALLLGGAQIAALWLIAGYTP